MVNLKIVIGIFLAFSMVIPVQSLILFDDNVSAAVPDTRQDELKDIQLHFHRDNTMDTNPPSATAPTANALRDGSGMEFTLNPPLYSDLLVKGQAKVNNQEALILVLDTNYIPIGSSSATITINVIESRGSSNTIIATNSFDLPHEATMRIPFTGGKTEHTFSSQSQIKVNVTASVSGSPTVRITYDHESYPGYLYVTCDQIGTMSLGAFRYDGTSGDFAPNKPDNRIMRLEGKVQDTFGGYDIDRVILNSPTLSAFPTDAEATVNAVNENAVYFYNWSYPYGIAPGQYSVMATIFDNTGNTYQDSTTVTIASYGVFLHIVEPEKADEKGKDVIFDLEVTNIGGNQDTFNLQSSQTLSWPIQFSTSSIGLAPNQTGDVTLTVSIPKNADDNQQNTISITATSSGNSGKKDTVDAIATALPASGFTFELVGSSTQEIEDTETATYNIKLTNTGDTTETFVVSIDDSPESGWQVTLEGGTPTSAGTGYIRREAILDENAQTSFVLRVTPSSPSIYTQVVEVSAFPKDDTGNFRRIKTTTKLSVQSDIQLIAEKTVLESSVKDASASTPAYDDVKFRITVNNLGAEVTLSFDYILPNSARDWTVTKPSDITLAEGDDDIVTFTITPSSSAVADEAEGYTISLSATSSDSSVTSKTTVFVKVKQFYKLEISVEDDKIATDNNQDLDYAINIVNRGNGNDVVTVNVDEDSTDWDFELSSSSQGSEILGSVVKVPIGPGKSARVILTVNTGEDARNGEEDSIQFTVQAEKYTSSDILTYQKFTITTKMEKSGTTAFFDALTELWILIVLVIALIIIAMGIFIKLKEKERERKKSE